MKICCFGVGGVGGYFGSLLLQKYKGAHDIHFIARGMHKDIICQNGLTLKRNGGNQLINVKPTACTDNLKEIPKCDIVVLSVKGYDLADASRQIAEITDKNTVILPLLNGVDIHERIRNYLHCGIVLRSCVYIGTHIEKPGVIYQDGGNCKILIGNDPDYPGFYPHTLLNLLKNAQIDYSWKGDQIDEAIWTKYIFIAAYGLVTATYGKTLGQILESPELCGLTRSIIDEIVKIANGLNVNLSEDVIEGSFLKAKQFPYETKTSFQRDVELKGKINERDLFGETLIKYGKKLKIPIPNTINIFRELNDKLNSLK